MSELILYTYFRSSASYRVRIALHVKGLVYQSRYIHLARDGGENWHDDYLQYNPQGLVPTLDHGGRLITQSLAIIEYLEQCFPEPSLFPSDTVTCAQVRAVAQIIACEIQPLNNLKVLGYLQDSMGQSDASRAQWYCHWIDEGFAVLETMLKPHSDGRFCFGDSPTLADACLIPQMYNAIRYNCDLQCYPLLNGIYRHCTSLPAFKRAAPENQGDAE